MWIAVDWGTSTLRAWRMQGEEVVAEASSERGMGVLEPGAFEGALRDLVEDWLPAPIVACGMVGARQGWAEAAYRAVPCAPLGPPFTRPPSSLDVVIVPGLSQAAPPDVMRGEETQIAGVLLRNPAFEGAICLPGTHSKWASVAGGRVTGFRSVMTGEVFALLSGRSVLRHGMAGDDIDLAAFDDALHEALAQPDQVPLRLFPLRAEGLLSVLAPAAARGRLSGLLIGAELAALRPMWDGHPVTLVGAGKIAALYGRALPAAQIVPGTEAVLAGLIAAHRMGRGT